MSQVINITRGELYAHIWTIPLNQLSGELNVRVVDLIDLCDRHQIPRPKSRSRRIRIYHSIDGTM